MAMATAFVEAPSLAQYDWHGPIPRSSTRQQGRNDYEHRTMTAQSRRTTVTLP